MWIKYKDVDVELDLYIYTHNWTKSKYLGFFGYFLSDGVNNLRAVSLIRFNQLKAVLIWVIEHAFHFFAIISAAWFSSSQVMVALQNLLLSQIMQSIGFLGPAFFLTQLSHVRTPAMAVLCMACSQVLSRLMPPSPVSLIF